MNNTQNKRMPNRRPTAGSGRRQLQRRRMARRRMEIITIVGCTLLVLIAGLAWTAARGRPGKASVSDAVLSYEPLIEKYAEEYGIPSYVPVIEAMMQQESSGQGTDVMQCSECYYNTEYEQKPGSIADAEYSIKTGIHYFADCLEMAGCRGPGDTRRLKLALQGYNFGHNYIPWAIERDGGYTKSGAEAFSELMQKNLGWDGYGDMEYPDHVLRYYE